MDYIDTHIHLDFYADVNKIVNLIQQVDMTAIFVTYIPELFERYYPQFSFFKNIHVALGYHPSMVEEYPLDKKIFDKCINLANFIGEVGLDYSITTSAITRESQRKVFEYISKKGNNKIFSIHSRQSEDDVMKILVENNVEKAVFHWYTGKTGVLNNILSEGYYLSLNPMMLKTNNGIKILERIPLEKILIESDGPFVKYNNQIIIPTYFSSIYKDFSQFYSITPSQLANIVNRNFNKLLNNDIF